jgi:hypothetical protein
MAGTGGFFGALIYYLGKPEKESEDSSVNLFIIKLIFNILTILF